MARTLASPAATMEPGTLECCGMSPDLCECVYSEADLIAAFFNAPPVVDARPLPFVVADDGPPARDDYYFDPVVR